MGRIYRSIFLNIYLSIVLSISLSSYYCNIFSPLLYLCLFVLFNLTVRLLGQMVGRSVCQNFLKGPGITRLYAPIGALGVFYLDEDCLEKRGLLARTREKTPNPDIKQTFG